MRTVLLSSPPHLRCQAQTVTTICRVLPRRYADHHAEWRVERRKERVLYLDVDVLAAAPLAPLAAAFAAARARAGGRALGFFENNPPPSRGDGRDERGTARPPRRLLSAVM